MQSAPIGAEPSGHEPPADGVPHWSRGDGGSFRWDPAPADTAALAGILEVLPGPDAVRSVAPAPGGLELELAGRALLVFPDTLGDVQLDTAADLRGFTGTITLAHHIHSMEDLGAFTVGSDGRAALQRVSGGREEALHQAAWGPGAAVTRLSFSVAGRHWKASWTDGRSSTATEIRARRGASACSSTGMAGSASCPSRRRRSRRKGGEGRLQERVLERRL